MKNSIIGLVSVALFAGVILLSQSLGFWKTESDRMPARITTGDFTGYADPADIRGSYSFGELEAAFGVPVADLALAFMVPDADENFQIKNFEEMFPKLSDGREIGTDSVRVFVSLYSGIPYEPDDPPALPMAAREVLAQHIMPADLEQLDAVFVGVILEADISGETQQIDIEEEVEVEVEHEGESDEPRISGTTTLREVLQYGISEEDIMNVLGFIPEDATMTLRDAMEAEGLSFGEYRSKLEALLGDSE